jgi:probable rRNA maturation factor
MYHIVIQQAAKKAVIPEESLLRKWAESALRNQQLSAAEITLRIVNVAEMTELNTTYRHKIGPTNVLSFPFSMPEEVEIETEVPILGDIVICAEVVNREATEQNKPAEAHWAHMVVHGVFHLLGYDHETDQDAEKMETLEIIVMHHLGFANPYETGRLL